MTLFTFKVISVYQLNMFSNETKQYKIRTDVVVHVKKEVTQTFSGHDCVIIEGRRLDKWLYNGFKMYSCKYALMYIMIVHSTL